MVKQLKKTIEVIQGKHSLDDLLQQVHRAEVDADDEDATEHNNNNNNENDDAIEHNNNENDDAIEHNNNENDDAIDPEIIKEIRGMGRTIPAMCLILT